MGYGWFVRVVVKGGWGSSFRPVLRVVGVTRLFKISYRVNVGW